jgi:HD-GYP domain-containing protein (c-di-GMP phosphodiesterase class II)
MKIKRNPWLRTLYLTMLLPVAAGVMAIVLTRHAIFYEHAWSDRVIEFALALLAAGLAIKCWGVTWEFARDMRRFLETLQAIKRGEFALDSARTGLPEIEDLARELSSMDESPDTSLAKWILLSRDHHAIFVRLVEAMSESMNTKSFYARGHSGRVAEYSSLICCELGLTAQESMRIRLSALLHDIGKIGMDQNILTKPCGLTANEFAILKTHPTRGADMLRPVLEFADLLPGVELHHESIDGAGYPHGFKGDEIPLMARVIAVADTFDAMTHNRTYQNAMDGQYALRIIRTMAGKKFDARAVDAFCRAYAAGRVVLPKRDESVEEEYVQSVAPLTKVTPAPLDALVPDTSDTSVTSSLVGASSN